MDRFANWLWRRFRRNYIAATAVVLTLFVAGAVAGMAGVTVSIALRVPLKDVLRLSAVNLTGQAVSATCLFLALSGPTARVRRWARGEPEDVTAVWNDTLRYPTKLGQRLALITFPMDHLVIMPIIFGIVGLTTTEKIVLHAVTPIMELSAVLVGALGARILATPIARELTPLLPPDAQPAQPELSARRRVAFAVFLAASNAALAAGAVALLVHNNEWRFAWVGLIAILTGSYTSASTPNAFRLARPTSSATSPSRSTTCNAACWSARRCRRPSARTSTLPSPSASSPRATRPSRVSAST
jgi:hypothetical protein